MYKEVYISNNLVMFYEEVMIIKKARLIYVVCITRTCFVIVLK